MAVSAADVKDLPLKSVYAPQVFLNPYLIEETLGFENKALLVSTSKVVGIVLGWVYGVEF